jgi:predicted transcriptional regulator
LKHRKVSRAFVYYPVVKRDEVSRSVVKDVIQKFFDDSPELLVLSVFENEQIDADELSRLKDMIEKYEETQR